MSSRRQKQTGSVFSSRVGQWTQPGIVKSIQRGTIAVNAPATSNTATITAVVPGNTRLVWLGCSSTGTTTTVIEMQASIALTNATTITATRTAGTTLNVIVSFEVIEYWPGVLRTVQRGTVTATAAVSGTATLATTLQNTTRATLDLLGFQLNFANLEAEDAYGELRLTNTTTVTLTRIAAQGNLTAGYQVCEWY
jgi:hypothetical protein